MNYKSIYVNNHSAVRW